MEKKNWYDSGIPRCGAGAAARYLAHVPKGVQELEFSHDVVSDLYLPSAANPYTYIPLLEKMFPEPSPEESQAIESQRAAQSQHIEGV